MTIKDGDLLPALVEKWRERIASSPALSPEDVQRARLGRLYCTGVKCVGLKLERDGDLLRCPDCDYAVRA